MIVIPRPKQKPSRVDEAIANARRISDKKLRSIGKYLDKVDAANDERIVKEFATRFGLRLEHHEKDWVFGGGLSQVSLPAGYYARVGVVLHQIVIK